jgi:Mg-chelatase subunit ChlD
VAAIYLEDPEGSRAIPLSVDGTQKVPELRRIEVPVDGPWVPKPYGVRGDDPALSQPDFKAKELKMVALYRGHVKPQDFAATSLEAEREVVYELPRHVKPTITVQGEATQGSSLVFILDCSGSMSAPTALGGRRMDVARNALKNVLAALAALPGEPYQVAVVAYGHRRGWGEGDTILVWDLKMIKDPKLPRDYEKQSRPATPAERRITPSNDVELIWPLGPLRKDSLDELNDRLDGLHPWGETPLYLSIVQAVDVASRATTPQRRIIAITDGVNEQSESPTSYEAVARKLADAKDVGLDVVRFRLSDQDLRAEAEARWKDDKDKVQAQLGEFKQKRAELEALTGTPGGQRRGNVFPVDDESRFLKALQDSLRLRQYVVRRAVDGELITRPPRNLDDTVTIEQAPGQKVRYVIALASQDPPVQKEVVLEGGEALQLTVKQVGERLELQFDRYDERRRGEPQVVADPADSTRRFYLAAHEPKRFESTARFYVSTQNGDKRDFSPRPEEAWVQVQPLGGDGPVGLPYAFYDARFWAGRPVPVLVCEALRWPAGAGRASITLWCRWKKTDSERIPIAELRRKGSLDLESPQATLQLEEKPGEAGGRYQVIVTERHPEGGDLFSLKVEMLPSPAKAIHQYFPESGKFHRPFVRHIFLYEGREADRIGAYEIHVTARTKLADPAQAVSLKEPFQVDIPTRDSPASEQQE